MPQRTCVGCRQTLAKRGMIRIVRTPEGLRVDQTGKLPGRGAYLHDRKSCWVSGLKGALAHALKTELSVTDREMLQSYLQTLPEDSDQMEPEMATPGTPIPEGTETGVERGKLGSMGNAP